MKRLLLAFVLVSLALAAANGQERGATVKSSEVVVIDGSRYYIHHVQRGETLSSLSRAYGVSIADIEEENPVLRDGLKAGQAIKIRAAAVPEVKMTKRQYRRTFEEHRVLPGETTYSIARRYLLSIQTLIEDNPGLDPSNIKSGQTLRIRRSETGETRPDAIREELGSMSATLNRLSEDYFYHVVDIGETIYSLSRRWNVDEELIRQYNDVSAGLRAGQMIKIPARGREDLKKDIEDIQLYFTGDRQVKEYAREGALNISMLLPLWSDSGIRTNFIEFYQGALLALEDFKRSGYSINFDLFDTSRSEETVRRIVASGSLDGADLIIGPVYEEEIGPVMEFATPRGIPVVSPLSSMNGRYNELLYQLTPLQENRYDKMKELFAGDRNIVFLVSDYNDNEFEREIRELTGPVPYQRVHYTSDLPSEYIDSLLVSNFRENLFVVTAGDELGVDRVLATLSSIQNNRLARSIRTGPIRVVGNPRWMRYQVVDKQLFFKLNVTFATSYHADRSDNAISDFDRRYIAAFSDIPSLYSYRGYDAVRMFGEALLEGDPERHFVERLNSFGRPLQTGYVFGKSPGGFFANTDWSLVTYRNNYTIRVE